MRKLTLMIAAVAFISTAVVAQTQQGSKFIGGGFSFTTNASSMTAGGTTTKGDRFNNFSFTPSVGYFIKDNLAVGAVLSFGSSRQVERDGSGDWNSNGQMGIAPFARYYKELVDKIYLFGHGQLGLNSSINRTRVADQTTSGARFNAFNISAGGGLALFPTEQFSIDLSFNLLNWSYGTNGTANQSGAGLGLNTLAPNIGLRYFF